MKTIPPFNKLICNKILYDIITQSSSTLTQHSKLPQGLLGIISGIKLALDEHLPQDTKALFINESESRIVAVWTEKGIRIFDGVDKNESFLLKLAKNQPQGVKEL